MAVAIIGASIGLAACGDDDPKATGVVQPRSQSIVDVAREAGNFETLIGALEATGLDSALEGPGPFTVFAPTDAAFERLPEGVIASLGSEALAEILTYHVSDQRLMASAVVTATSAPTLHSSAVTIDASSGTVILNGTVQVTTTDMVADNGVIHVIDSVLLPPSWDFPGTIVDAVSAYPIFDALRSAVVAGDLADALASGERTVFAPTNSAFSELPAGTLELLLDPENQSALVDILTYHVIDSNAPASTVVGLATAKTLQGSRVKVTTEGSNVWVNEASVTWTDIRTSNGTIHVIDTVIIPPEDIVSVAQSAGVFSTLLAAVEGAGLTATLSGDNGGNGFTVFAPTDTAFAAINASGDLTDILLYHVLSGEVDSKAAMMVAGSMMPYAETLSGAMDNDIELSVYGGTLAIDHMVQITMTDIVASNGIIHVVDAVMLPGGVAFPGTIVEALSAHPFFDSLVQAVVATDLAGTLSGDNGGEGYTIFAPTNAAFDALGVDLATLSSEDLTDILLYHAVGSTVGAATVVGLSSATSIEGSSIAIDASDGVMLNDSANVVRTDLVTSNGIIHVIDAVLLPAP